MSTKSQHLGPCFWKITRPFTQKCGILNIKVISNNEFHYVSPFFRHVSILFSTIFPKIVVVYYLREVNL